MYILYVHRNIPTYMVHAEHARTTLTDVLYSCVTVCQVCRNQVFWLTIKQTNMQDRANDRMLILYLDLNFTSRWTAQGRRPRSTYSLIRKHTHSKDARQMVVPASSHVYLTMHNPILSHPKPKYVSPGRRLRKHDVVCFPRPVSGATSRKHPLFSLLRSWRIRTAGYVKEMYIHM